MRVLLSAYACAPGRGSEPGLGWGWATALVEAGHETHVLTRRRWRTEIESALAGVPRAGLHFHYHDLPSWLDVCFRALGGPGKRLRYCLWQVAARGRVRSLGSAVRFDVAQHVTFAQFWSPCALTEAARLGVPFIWGPVGGGETEPAAFWPGLGMRAALWEAARWLLHRASPWLPWARATAAACRLAVAATPETAECLVRLGARRVIVRSQVALETDRLEVLASLAGTVPQAAPASVIFLGDLLPHKGARLALEAVAGLSCAWRLDIIGDGPDRAWLERRAVRLGIAGKVVFHGRLPQDAAWRLMAAGRVLLLPALHDSGGFAVAEAMAAGVPPVCLALGGPGAMAAEGGIAVPAPGPAEAVRGLTQALRSLIEEPARWQALSLLARGNARDRFGWPAAIGAVHGATGLGIGQPDGLAENGP
ncbi:glycosyltransferase family 4 protein [Azospirillum sp. TSH100]|uniref:glycosyltransferase family 4 protein n=1 Tax=Azospirillum sp. TSH100 TaxID=652764 RepID=UPI000D6571FD|nr:glycosyltransferase family 4 protein [Azospirillum sp. TSH100]QCG91054.1 glycosyltransferase family 4 protein [Azospirillum sp. TSH100]